MATCKQSPEEFIKNAFTPQIAVICSPQAQKCCEKNNLNFVELLQPFCKFSNDVYCKDYNGTVTTIKNFKLAILDVNHRPPQTVFARKLLNLAVSEASESRCETITSRNYQLEIPMSTPWFENWRDTFLQVQYPSDHEYTKHFLACMLIVSSTDINPTETMIQLAQNLNQMYSNTPGKLPKWFSSNILKYYVIIHDVVEGDMAKATESYENIKSSYGSSNSFLLKMNSRPPGNEGITEHVADPWIQFIQTNIKSNSSSSSNAESIYELAEEANEAKSNQNETYHPLSPNNESLFLEEKLIDKEVGVKHNGLKVHGLCLGAEDLENIKTLITDFSKNCLIPYVERQIQMLSDNIANKKGVSRSLFSATKRWFNPNKPGTNAVVNNLMYGPDAPELQVRRLADLYFMFGNYAAAFQAYHLAKRDFNNDQAWVYYAGALEMAALSAFMANETSRKSHEYLEESITTYLNTCKMPQFATRATLLGSECLKIRSLFGEAALQLIRMTSEESDLRSALLLEQASYCFLKTKMVRKYAFHMVLAGHRYSKAAQRKHSLRSYKQAYQIFKGNGWNLASDHIHYTIGRQANNLNSYDEAVESFSKLLLGESKQTPQQQLIFLNEYLMILANKLKHSPEDDLSSLPLPNIDIESLKVLLEPLPPIRTPGRVPAMGMTFTESINNSMEQKWAKLEEIIVQEAQGSLPILFKPMSTLFNYKKLSMNVPNAIVNEPIQVSLQIVNELQVVLNLKDIHLMWNFKNDGRDISNEKGEGNKVNEYIYTQVLEFVALDGASKVDIVLSLTPLNVGELTVTGICYTISIENANNEGISIKGKQMINLTSKIGDKVIDSRLKIRVVPPAPCLQVTFSEIHSDCLCDEMQKIIVNLRNVGNVSLQNVHLASTTPRMVSSCQFNQVENPAENSQNAEAIQVKEKLARKKHITNVPLPNGVLKSGEATSITIWIKAPSTRGPYSIDLLIYYENVNVKSIPRYRLIKQNWNLTVQDSITIAVNTMESANSRSVEELSLSIQVTNTNRIHNTAITEISLTNISLLSRQWMFMEKINSPQDITLHSQEVGHLSLKTKRRISEKSDYSIIQLGQKKNSIDNQLAYLAFAKRIEQPTVRLFDNLEHENLKETKNGILLIQWEAVIKYTKSSRLGNGQSFVPIVYGSNKLTQYPEIPINDLPISLEDDIRNEKDAQTVMLKTQLTYNVIAPSVIKHNFRKNQLCLVPVRLLLHSIVDQNVLEVTVNTINCIESNAFNAVFLPNASRHFKWIGSGVRKVHIKPLSSTSMNLSVAVYGPGCFDLGSQIEIYSNELHGTNSNTLQNCQICATLIVTDSNS